MTWWMEERFNPETNVGVLLDDYPEIHTALFFQVSREICEQYRDQSIAYMCDHSMKVFSQRLLEALNLLPVFASRADP